jgi:hypothetical protein
MTFRARVALAAALWLTFAIIAWNVVFDRIIVVAGRTYILAASRTARETNGYLLLGPWMRAAVTRAFWWATVVGVAIAVCGLIALAFAVRANSRQRRDAHGETT